MFFQVPIYSFILSTKFYLVYSSDRRLQYFTLVSIEYINLAYFLISLWLLLTSLSIAL